MIASRSLDDLQPQVREKAEAFLDACASAGIDVIVTSTLRDNESQAELYAQGRTTIGRVVTNAMPGHSFHNYGLAFDFVPILNGKATWNDDRLWSRCGAIGQSVGLEWGGAWKFTDKPHMQFIEGVTIAQLLAREKVAQA